MALYLRAESLLMVGVRHEKPGTLMAVLDQL